MHLCLTVERITSGLHLSVFLIRSPPVGKHAESQENDGETGAHAWTGPCWRGTRGTKMLTALVLERRLKVPDKGCRLGKGKHVALCPLKANPCSARTLRAAFCS